MDNGTLIHVVINTLQDLDIKPTRENMEKLMGCNQVLNELLKNLGEGGMQDGGTIDSQ